MTPATRSKRWLATPVAAIAITACHGAPRPAEPSAEIQGERIGVAVVPTGGTFELEWRAADASPIARLRAARLVLADGSGDGDAAVLPFVRWHQPSPDRLRLECAPASGHAVAVAVRLSGPDETHVEVTDEVSRRSHVRELTLDYSWLQGSRLDRIVTPYRSHRPEQLAGDLVFHAPVTFLRRGAAAFALTPDLDGLARDRRIPQAIEMLRAPWTVRHGLVAHRVADPTAAAVFTRDGAPAVAIGAERLGFGHYVRALADAQPHTTLATTFSALWNRTAGRRSGLPPQGPSLVAARQHALVEFAATTWRDHGGVGGARDAGSYSSAAIVEADLEPSSADAWFGVRRQALRTAYAELERSARDGVHATDRAAKVTRLALSAPRRSGLVPSRFHIDAGGSQIWQPNDPNGVLADHHHVFDAAVSGYWLLELRQHLPELRAGIDDLTHGLARFLMQNQRASGSIPAFYDQRFLTPRRDVYDDRSPECGAAAVFLAAYAELYGEPEAEVAAQRALRFLGASMVSEQDWPDFETLDGGSTPRPRSGVSGTLGLLFAARACFAAQTIAEDPELTRLGTEFCERLATMQSAWSPNWIDDDLVGGIRSDTDRVEFGDARQALAADAFLRAYRATGRREFLQRGAAALRSGLRRDAGAWTPFRSDPEDSNWGRTTAIAIAELTSEHLGRAVVDVAGGFAEGLDAVWFEDLQVDGDRCSFRFLTEQAVERPVRVVFHGMRDDLTTLDLVVNGEDLGTWPRARLAAGIDLEPERVPRLEFRPPRMIQQAAIWAPHATYTGSLRADARAFVEFWPIDGQAEPARIPLELATSGRLSARNEPILALELGTEIAARLVVETGDGRRVVVPPDEPRRITVGTKHCIDPGDSDESELFDAAGTHVVRYVDGREFARRIEPGQHASYRLPLPPTAAVAELEIDVAGPLEVASGPNVLHEDASDDFVEPRTITIRVSDPRLWQRDRALLLRLESGTRAGCSVAQIRFSAEGHAPTVTDLVSEPIREADSRIRIAVVPLELPDNPLRTQRAALERVFFGDSEYRLTPEPNARLTSGSVAQLIQRASGGISELRGVVRDRLRVETPSAADRDELLRAVLAGIGGSLGGEAERSGPAVVVAVYGGTENPNLARSSTLELADGGRIPIVLLPEQSADGSILSSGTVLLALLDELYEFEQLGTVEAGNFGELALSATDGGHVPVRIAGINLVRSGWAQFLRADPRLLGPDHLLAVEVAPVERGRSVLRLPSADLPDRGELLIENCGQTSSDPWVSNSGALLYRAFPPGAAPWIRSGSAQVRARFLRLSADRPEWRTPFAAATGSDLFRANNLVDDASTLTLATLHGDEFWALRRIRTELDGTTRLWLDYLARHLLRDRSVAWQRRVGDTFVPVSRRATRDGASVVAGGDSVSIETAPEVGSAVRGIVALPHTDKPLRMLGRLDGTAGSGLRATIRIGDVRVLEFDVDEHTTGFQVDLAAEARGPASLELVRTGPGSGACRITELLLVPRSVPRFPIRLADVGHATLSDGTAYSTGRIAIGEEGEVRRSLPVVVPEQDAMLLLWAGLTPGSAPIRLSAHIDGVALIEDFEFTASEAPQPLPLLITAIPESCEAGVESLELTLRGVRGNILHLVQIAVSD